MQDALALLQRGLHQQAEQVLRELTQTNPEAPHPRYLLGVTLTYRNADREAAQCMRSAIELGLSDPGAHFQYGMTLLKLGELHQARGQFALASTLAPDFIEATQQKANCDHALHRLAEAEQGYRRCLAHSSRNWQGHFNLGHTLYQQGRYDEAVRSFCRARDLRPDDAEILATLATQYELMHRVDDARDCAREALALDGGNGSARIVMARLLRRDNAYGAALESLARIDVQHTPPLSLANADNERGHALDALGRYEEAFAAFTRSKKAFANYRNVDKDTYQVMKGAIEPSISAIPANTGWRWHRLASIPERTCGLPRPIFILGFFRCGSTLLEQMLARHDDIATAGESEQFQAMLREHWPDGDHYEHFAQMSADKRNLTWQELRRDYLERIINRTPTAHGKPWVIDKTLFNFQHLPLLQLLFPEGVFIRMVRHPLDVVLSCFFHNFLQLHPWSYEIDSIVRHYKKCHEYWGALESTLQAPVQKVVYETLVNDPEHVIRSILLSMHTKWDPRCLTPQQSKHIATTASYAQVRKPINSASLYRYRNYLPWLTPHIDGEMHSLITELGYATN